MKRTNLLFVSATVLLLLTAATLTARARTIAEDPPRDLARMLVMEGSWTSEGQMMYGGKTYAITYKCTFKKTADGSGMTMEEWFDSPDLGKMRGMNLIGYDVNTKTVRWFSVDNMGTAHEHTGTWTSDTHFSMDFHGKSEGKKFDEVITMDLEGHDRCKVHVTGNVAGKLREEFTGVFVRDAH
jgi:hypothetical protein